MGSTQVVSLALFCFSFHPADNQLEFLSPSRSRPFSSSIVSHRICSHEPEGDSEHNRVNLRVYREALRSAAGDQVRSLSLSKMWSWLEQCHESNRITGFLSVAVYFVWVTWSAIKIQHFSEISESKTSHFKNSAQRGRENNLVKKGLERLYQRPYALTG